MRKLTPELIRKIRAMRKRGKSHQAIADKLEISKGSVANALASGAAPKKLEPPDEDDAPIELPKIEGDPPTIQEIRKTVADVLQGFRLDAAKARSKNDPDAAAKANRNIVAVTLLLARITPDGSEDGEGLFVTHEQLDDAAARCRSALHALIDRELEKKREA